MARAAFAAIVALALAPAVVRAAPVHDPGCSVIELVQRSDQVIYPLPRRLLRDGSDSLWTASRAWTRGVDYGLDRTRGVLRLRVPPVPGETLRVRVCGLVAPPVFSARFAEFRASRAGPDSAPPESLLDAPPASRPGSARSTTEAPSGATLAIQGNKTIAVDFGSNQDAFLRQSLDLAVSGALAPGVELTGVLSDRNTPLTSAGSTRDLQSLDRLLIELRAPQGGASLGDVALALDHGEFSRIERRVQGVRGEWSHGNVSGVAAAASAQGEYQRMEFFGVEGRQGPYRLNGADGTSGISVVAGSEVVTLDGERLTRGESADYSMDYERAQITFTNRRPVGSASRITVDYQVSVNRFRRNLAALATRWSSGPLRFSTAVLTEGDDRGRPIASTLDPSDRLVLATVGDSTGQAVGSGVSVGGGDYDLVADSTGAHYAFAGPDSGDYAVRFTLVGSGQGDYLDSTQVAGRVAYRFVGAGLGAYRIGRRLPLPDTHQLWSASGGATLGPLQLDLEGAFSRLDRNTFSTLDDADNVGRAGRARLAVEGKSPRWLGGRMGVAASSRGVERRFEPFTRLEAPFSQEDWGLAPGSDLERQTRHEVGAFLRPGIGGELRAAAGRLETPAGFESFRRTVSWDRSGRWITRARWERADGEERARASPEGGRERRAAELGWRHAWVEPVVRADWDRRWAPNDSARSEARSREVAAELRTGAGVPWRVAAAVAVRREGERTGAGSRDLYDIHTTRLTMATAEGKRWSATGTWQRRAQKPLAIPGRTVSDLASARWTGNQPDRGLSGSVGLEVTSEAESERTRQLVAVGTGLGAYDSLGNFVGAGRGDYSLTVVTGTGLARIARAAGSTRLSWQPRLAAAWQGSRVDLTVETEARRRGALRGADAWLTPGSALGDGELSRGSVTQRFEADLAPGARAGAVRLRLERRVSADRSFSNFSQGQDERTGTARLRARPAPGWTSEVEGRLKRQSAEQQAGAARAARALRESGVLGQVGYAPHARLRVALVSDLAWTRDEALEGQVARAWKWGPELGVSVIERGRLELSARRIASSGPVLGPLLPGADPVGALKWESTARFDYRLGDQTTIGVSMISRDRDGRAPEHEGRAEAKAFF